MRKTPLYTTADKLNYIQELIEKGRLDVLSKYARLVWNGGRSYDPAVNVTSVKAKLLPYLQDHPGNTEGEESCWQ